MDRRRFIGSAIGLAGLGLTSSTVTARDEGELPNDNVATSTVAPFLPSTAEAGDWIRHAWGWVESWGSSAENRDRVQEYFDAFDPVVWIDGERIENRAQYYGELKPATDREDAWVKLFTYYTPPKPVGEHSFRFEPHFHSDFTVVDAGPPGALCSENRQIEAGDVTVMDEGYVVKPSKGGNGP